MTTGVSAAILHVDMDAFYASIEQRDHPEWKGKPVIIGSMPGTRGVVSTASYEARVYGVGSAMPISQAYKRCPQGIYVKPRMSYYSKVSKAIFQIFERYTPEIEPLSIDEAFLDVTGSRRLHGSSSEIAHKILTDIEMELGLTASVGVAHNKFLAKLASDMNKPNGITHVPQSTHELLNWLAPLPIKKLWGVGPKSREVLFKMNVQTIGDVQKLSLDILKNKFGKMGGTLHRLCRGVDERIVEPRSKPKSVSKEHTFQEDTDDWEYWLHVLITLSREVAENLRAQGLKGSTVTFTYRTPSFKRHSKQVKLEHPTQWTMEIFQTVQELLEISKVHGKKLRLIGVGVSGFENKNFSNVSKKVQTDLFAVESTNNENTLDQAKKSKDKQVSETAMDKIHQKFGKNAIVFGREVKKK